MTPKGGAGGGQAPGRACSIAAINTAPAADRLWLPQQYRGELSGSVVGPECQDGASGISCFPVSELWPPCGPTLLTSILGVQLPQLYERDFFLPPQFQENVGNDCLQLSLRGVSTLTPGTEVWAPGPMHWPQRGHAPPNGATGEWLGTVSVELLLQEALSLHLQVLSGSLVDVPLASWAWRGRVVHSLSSAGCVAASGLGRKCHDAEAWAPTSHETVVTPAWSWPWLCVPL